MEIKKKKSLMTAKVSGTEDKMRIRFLFGTFTEKMRQAITDFFQLKWRKDVIVTRWPRSDVVEIRLSHQMIRTAGFLEVTQEVHRYWQAFLDLVQKQIDLKKAQRT